MATAHQGLSGDTCDSDSYTLKAQVPTTEPQMLNMFRL